MNGPWPDGYDIGGFFYEDTHYKGVLKHEWYAVFEFDDANSMWRCVYVYDERPQPELVGVGDTPLAAFESLVNRWTIANGGTESPVLRRLLPEMRAQFNHNGGFPFRPARLKQSEHALLSRLSTRIL